MLDHVRLTWLPFRFGAGVKGKVLESLGAGVPRHEGIALPPELMALLVDDEGRMGDLIVRHSDSEGDWTAISASASEFMAETYSGAKILAGMRAAIDGESTPTAS